MPLWFGKLLGRYYLRLYIWLDLSDCCLAPSISQKPKQFASNHTEQYTRDQQQKKAAGGLWVDPN